MAVNLDALVIHIIINSIIISPVLCLSGRSIAGKEKAKFTDAIWIVVLGTVIGAVIGFLFTGLIASVIQLVLWLLLVKRFFDTGWLAALAISIIAVIIFIVIVSVLGIIGLFLIRIF